MVVPAGRRRRWLILVILVALAIPAGAFAATRHYRGPVSPSGNVAFDAKVRAGKVVKVKPGFTFNHIPMTCNEGQRTVSGNFNFAMKVHRKRFHGTGIYNSSAGTGTVAVKGRFKRHGRKAAGTINASGNFSPGGQTVTGCHSGSLPWHAHRR